MVAVGCRWMHCSRRQVGCTVVGCTWLRWDASDCTVERRIVVVVGEECCGRGQIVAIGCRWVVVLL